MKYDIVYADPPWAFRNYSDKWHVEHPESRWVGNEYGLMSLQDLADLPVGSIATKDAVLFLWTTMPHLEDGLKMVEAWGFTYKTVAFTWIKQNRSGNGIFMGMGFWTRSNAELCLLATRGHPKRISKSVQQVILSPLRGHSEKPAETRDRIIELLGDRPRIELFARDRVAGWDAWGDEIASDLSFYDAEGAAE